MCIFLGTLILSRFWEEFGWVWGSQNLRFSRFFRNFFDKNPYKIEVKKNSEKSEESGARLPLAGRPTPWSKPPQVGVLATFYGRISAPCRREANFRVLA